MSKSVFWARVRSTTPWSEWWPRFCEENRLSPQVPVEKWEGCETSWNPILDSGRNFSLFSPIKILVVSDAHKICTREKISEAVWKEFERLPHPLVLVSEQDAAKTWKGKVWSAKDEPPEPRDDKAVFRWIENIHKRKLTEALSELEVSLQNDRVPLVLLQILSRDLRMGRLIQHAIRHRLKEKEISDRLKMNPYGVKIWSQRKGLRNSQWHKIFDRILECDLELKSQADPAWALRKLTFDLIQQLKGDEQQQKNHLQSIFLPQQPRLWPTETSYA